MIAEALSPYPEDLVVATKGGAVKTGPAQVHFDGSPGYLRGACEASLRRLGVDNISLYQLHRPDPLVPFEESVGALAELREEGKIRHVGLCNVEAEQLALAWTIVPLASVQNRYSLSDRESDGLVDLCADEGIAFLPYGPLGAKPFEREAPLTEPGGPPRWRRGPKRAATSPRSTRPRTRGRYLPEIPVLKAGEYLQDHTMDDPGL